MKKLAVRKLWLLIGAGIGFLAGSKAGTGPYERVQAMVRNITNKPSVQDSVDSAVYTARHVTDKVVDGAADRVEDASEMIRTNLESVKP